MKHLQRIGAGFLLIIALSIPALAGNTQGPGNPGETQTPPGETQTPPCITGETACPPGETQGASITGDILGPGLISLIASLL